MKHLYLLPLLLLASLSGHAQRTRQDFVVKTNGDTLRGEFRESFYQPAGKPLTLYQGAVALPFTPESANSYGDAAGAVVVSRQVGPRGPHVFVRPVALGYLSLYADTDERGQSQFYLLRPDSSYVVKIVPTSAQLTLNRLMGDCPTLQFGTDETRRRYPISYRGMRALVLAYNACRRPDQPTRLVTPGADWRVERGLKAGINRTSFDYGTQPVGQAQSPGLSYQAGLLLHAYNRSRLSVQLEAMVLALRGDYAPAAIYTGTSLYSLTGSTRIRFLQLQIPLLLRYRLGHGPVLQPYLNAGPCYGQTFSNSSAIVYRYSNRTEDETLALQLSDRFSLGYVAGAGVLIRRRTGPSLNLEVRFDQVVDAPNNVYYTPQHKSLRLDVGVIF